MLELKLICESDKERVLDYIKELVNNGSQTDGIWYTDAPNFEIMLESLRSHENLEYLCMTCHNQEHFNTQESVRDDVMFDSEGNLVKVQPPQ